MGSRFLLFHNLRKLRSFSLLPLCSQAENSLLPTHRYYSLSSRTNNINPKNPFTNSLGIRHFTSKWVNLKILEGKPKFEINEAEPSKKKKWLTKKRLKLKRKKEKQRRKAANKNDPRQIRPRGTKLKNKFVNAEERIKYKLEKAKMKEAILVGKLKKYEVPQMQGPMVKPEQLSGEERFYFKKMTQKRSNYVPIGRRGIFGGVILNMHLHWKKHETVKVICKPCKPGQLKEYAKELARLSGGSPIQYIGDNTIVFYRGKNYVQPEVLSPIDTLSKKKALEKSKYEQSLEAVRRFIAISEKELELYYRHLALYGDPQTRNRDLFYGNSGKYAPYSPVGSSTGDDLTGVQSNEAALHLSGDSNGEDLTGDESDEVSDISDSEEGSCLTGEDLNGDELDGESALHLSSEGLSDISDSEADSGFEEFTNSERDENSDLEFDSEGELNENKEYPECNKHV